MGSQWTQHVKIKEKEIVKAGDTNINDVRVFQVQNDLIQVEIQLFQLAKLAKLVKYIK